MKEYHIQSLSRTGHNSIAAWIKANSLEPCTIDLNDDQAIKHNVGSNNIIIIRDVYNWFASWLTAGRKWMTKPHIESSIPRLITIWKQHAKNFLGEAGNNTVENATVILFDRWCVDREYRDTIAQKLNMSLDDKMFSNVSNQGGGSTWDGMKFDGKANEMKVHDRWQLMTKDKQYCSSLNDTELHDLNYRVFGNRRSI